MAKPPEPLIDVLPRASLVVDGEVVRVVSTGAKPPTRLAPAEHKDVGHEAASQIVVLKVRRVLKGDGAPAEITATKPQAGYALREGNQGPFLLEEGNDGLTILGRYGPDSYRIDALERALAGA